MLFVDNFNMEHLWVEWSGNILIKLTVHQLKRNTEAQELFAYIKKTVYHPPPRPSHPHTYLQRITKTKESHKATLIQAKGNDDQKVDLGKIYVS